ncbi:MAG: UvrD-helicase domain-containing protein [Verrucomicrobia bacterium]|nr:UvrD-helicase domain-containing protein [Verrucomicrobiota bacterium]
MSEQTTFTNKALFASAGTGKTFQLTDRFIYILHHTLEPEKIIALTFTRAAAGEFFVKIVEKLYLACTDANEASALSKRLKINADQAHYKKLLSIVLKQLHRLNLQTLDSFLHKILNCFGPEIGFTENLQLLSENSRKLSQKAVRDSIIYEFKQSTGKVQSLKQFWQAFKQSNYGESNNSIDKTLQDYIEKIQELYLESPIAEQWGSIETIWGDVYPWINLPLHDWSELSEQLIAEIPKASKKSEENAFFSASKYIANYPNVKKTPVLIERSIDNFSALEKGKALIKIRQSDILIEGKLAEVLFNCVKNIFSYHIKRSTQSTQGTYKILEIYNQAYDRQVRQYGKVTFSDLIHILNPKSSLSPFHKQTEDTRDLLYYRLDARYDHWLFDEFQDTSRSQWAIIKDLVDEAIQDSERTAFFVGDTKQSLYLWRNSDDRLFQSICEYYENAIERPNTLSESYRSAPAIMDAVNRVFDDRLAIQEYYGKTTSERWFRAWEKHYASEKTQNEHGYATWIDISKNGKSDKETSVLNILKGLKDKSDNLSIGILVGKNSEAIELAYFLREQGLGIPIRIGSSLEPANDNAAGVALIAMLRYCIHPSDQKSKQYLGMIDASTKGDSLIQTVDRLRPQASAIKSSQLVLEFSQAIISKLSPDDQRHRKSLQYLIENAEKFDREEVPLIKNLITYLKDFSLNDSGENSVITVETIHRSKGLEYDVVIFINNDKKNFTEKNIKAYRNQDQEVEWVLEPFKKDVMQSLNKTSDFFQQTQEENHFSSLCKLYVAMTRAKKALYMMSDINTADTQTPVRFLKTYLGEDSEEKELFENSTFSVLWETGDADWHKSLRKNKELDTNESAISKQRVIPSFQPTHQRLSDFTPSKIVKNELQLITNTNSKGKYFGQLVHHALEHFDWYDNSMSIESLITNKVDSTILEHLKACFADKHIQEFFHPPSIPCILWKEKAFTLSENQILINGVFDRVHIFLDTNNRYIKAQIIDFKTDFISEDFTIAQAIEKHEKQLQSYQNALSKLLNLDKANIETYLLFTSAKALHKVH